MIAGIAPWVWSTITAGLAVTSLAVLWLGLRWDPARGRHRCPHCWYDMATQVQTGTLRCPECGRSCRRMGQLQRTRRSRRLLLIGVGLALLALAAAATPTVRQRGWQHYAPTTLLICVVPSIAGAQDRTQTELLVRLRGDKEAESFYLSQADLRTGPLWRWQRSLLCHRCVAALEEGRDPAARTFALSLLVALRSEASPAVPRLRELLRISSSREVFSVVAVIDAIGPAAVECVPELVPLVSADGTDDMFYVGCAIHALGHFGPEARSAIPQLLRILEAAPRGRWFGDEEARLQAIQTLGLIGPDARVAIPVLAALAGAGTGQDRVAAVRALGGIDPFDPRANAAIHAALQDSEIALRAAAAEIVCRDPKLVAPTIDKLTQLLQASDVSLRISGARALMTLKAAAAPAVADLARCLGDESPVVRIHAVRALAEIGPPAAPVVPALRQSAGGSDLNLKREVDLAMARIRVDKE